MEQFMHLLFLVFLSASCASENITVVYGVEGGTISVNCTYNPWQQRWSEKSWCRQVEESKCQRVVRARPFWLSFLSSRNGTTLLRDNSHQGILTVTMQQLKKQDAGLYQCITDFLGETNSLRKVQVEVLTAVLETQMPEEPRAVQSISRIPQEGDFTLFYIFAGLLGSKLVMAVLILITDNIRKSKKKPSLAEQQGLPLPGDGISSFWESSA